MTIITRAIALGQIDRTNAERILRKELLVGVLNGLAWSLVVALFTYLWFGQWRIGAVIAGAMGGVADRAEAIGASQPAT